MDENEIGVIVTLRDLLSRPARRVARRIDDIGDEASESAREVAGLETALATTGTTSTKTSSKLSRMMRMLGRFAKPLGIVTLGFSRMFAMIGAISGIVPAAITALTALSGSIIALIKPLGMVLPMAATLLPMLASMGLIVGVGVLAFKGLGGAIKALSDPSATIEEINEALKGLGPNAREFARGIVDIKDELTPLKEMVQETFLEGMVEPIKHLIDRWLPGLEYGLMHTAENLNFVLIRLMDTLANDTYTSAFNDVLAQGSSNATLMAIGLGEMVKQGLLITQAVGPQLNRFLMAVNGQLAEWTFWMENNPEEMAAFFERSGDAAADFWTGTKNLTVALWNLSELAQPLRDVMGRGDLFADLRAFTESEEGSAKITKFFENLVPTVEASERLFWALGEAIVQLGQSQVFPLFMNFLADVLPILSTTMLQVETGLIQPLVESLPALMPLLGTLGMLLGTLADQIGPVLAIAVRMLAPVFNDLLIAIAPLVPIVGNFLMAALGAVVPIIQMLGEYLVLLAPKFGEILTALMPLLPALSQGLLQIMEALLPVAMQFIDALLPFVPVIVDIAVALVPLIVRFAQDLAPLFILMIQTLLPPLLSFLTWIAEKVGDMSPLVGTLAGAFGIAIGVIKFLSPIISVLVGWFVKAITWIKNSAMALTILRTVFTFLTGPIGIVIGIISLLVGAFVWAYNNVEWFRDGVDAAVEWVRNAFETGFDWIQKNVIEPFPERINQIGEAFQNVAEWIGDKWAALRDMVASPINFIITEVYNKGIVRFWNAIAERFGLATLSTIAPIASATRAREVAKANSSGRRVAGLSGSGGMAAATGGVLPGWSPGVDNMHFYSPQFGSLSLSGGESIMRPEFTRAVGGERGVDAINKAAMAGAFAKGGVFGKFAGGGVAQDTSGDQNWFERIVSGIGNFISDPIGTITSTVMDPVRAMVGAITSTPYGKMIAEVPLSIVRSIIDNVKNKVGGWFATPVEEGGGAGTVHVGPPPGGGSWRRPTAGPITSRFGVPRGGYKHQGIDIAGGGATYAAAPGTVYKTGSGILAGRTGLGIGISHGGGMFTYYGHNPVGGIQVKQGQIVAAGQRIGAQGATGNVTGVHLHFELHRGGWGNAINPSSLGVFDTGGWMMPGQAGINLTNRPELVLNGPQQDALARGVSGTTVIDNSFNPNVRVQVHNPRSEIDIERAVVNALEKVEKNRRERR